MAVEDEGIVTLKEKVSLNENTDKKYDKVKDERSQWKEKLIIVGRKEVKDNEKHGRRIAPKVAFVSKKCIRQSPFVQNNAPFNHLRNAAKLSCFFKKS